LRKLLSAQFVVTGELDGGQPVAVLCPTHLQQTLQNFTDECIATLPCYQDFAGSVNNDIRSSGLDTINQLSRSQGCNVHSAQMGIDSTNEGHKEHAPRADGWHMSISRAQPMQRSQRKSLLREVEQAAAAARVGTLKLDTLMVRLSSIAALSLVTTHQLLTWIFSSQR
jgi:hypothetical protein